MELIKGDEWQFCLRRVVIIRTTPKFVWFDTANNGVEKIRIDQFLRQAINVDTELNGIR